MGYVPASASEITAWMEAHPAAERITWADTITDRLDAITDADAARFPVESCDAVLRAISGIPDQARRWLASRAPSPASLYLKAGLLTSHRAYGEAADAWEQLLGALPCRDPQMLLQYARLLAGLDDYERAAARLREALACRPGYAFHARAASVIERVGRHAAGSLRQLRIAVLGSSTTQLLVQVLRALCFRDRIQAEFYEGSYGAFRQEILDAGSGLYRFAPTTVILVPNWRDLHLPPVCADQRGMVEGVVGEFRQLWALLAGRTRAHVVHQGFDLPAIDSHGDVAARPGGRTRVIQSINLALAEAAPAFVSVLDTVAVQVEAGLDAWEDAALWCTAKQHPGTTALPALAEAHMACIRAAAGLARKVVVCDLDNTLWGGIIGEDGLDGIRIGAGTPAGEAHAALQEYLLELLQRGVLLAVCSKNNPEDARAPFELHPQMRLRLEHFAAFVANWRDKVENLQSIASMLSLGLDSFVFLDDNPFERAWVRARLPEVEVVELGRSPFTFVAALDRLRLFQAGILTEEDQRRTALYQQAAAREVARESAGSLDEFLQQLFMRATDVPVGPANLARVTQLINKTNQFNLTTRRRTEAAVAQIAADDSAWVHAFHLADRFGDHGLIGVLICTAPAPGVWEIDTWLMSCRVLGRRMERFMFERLREAALAAGISRLVGVYRPTAKNAQVADLYPQLGFRPAAADADGQRYDLLLSGAA